MFTNEIELKEYTEELFKNHKDAILKLYDYIFGFFNYESYVNDIQHDYLTETVEIKGKKYLWYLDELNNYAICLETLEIFGDEYIENEIL